MAILLPDIDKLLNECRFTASRSSGKGGQNVNKVSTKMILLFNVLESDVLDQNQKDIFILKLSSRISKQGFFRISSSVERTQFANRKRVIEKFIHLLEKAFETEEERIATKPTAGSKRKRAETKKEQSEKKSLRRGLWSEDSEF